MGQKKCRQEFERATVCFASGTGNSYRVAKWFEEACRSRGIQTRLTPVNLADPKKEIIASSSQLVALAFPAHGLLPPWSVVKFLFKMPSKRGARFLCLPTRGSLFIGPVLVPGAAGLGSFLPALILLFKGFRPLGAVSFDMPVNMTSLHPPLTRRHAGRVVAAAQGKFRRYMERFFRKRSLWLTRNNLYELVWSVLILAFIPLFPFVYLLVGRFWMGKTLFAGDRCTGCGSCAKSCPAGALVMKGGKAKRPFWRYNCEYCLRCLNTCPQHAVVSGIAWAALLWSLAAALAYGSWLFTQLTRLAPWLRPLRNYWTVELLNSIFYYPAIIAAYFLFFLLLGFRPLNLAFSYASLSRHVGQYREPETHLKDLTQKENSLGS